MPKYYQIDVPWHDDRIKQLLKGIDPKRLQKALSPPEELKDCCAATTLKPYMMTVCGRDYQNMGRKIQKRNMK